MSTRIENVSAGLRKCLQGVEKVSVEVGILSAEVSNVPAKV